MNIKHLNLRLMAAIALLCATMAVSAQKNDLKNKAQKSLIEYLKEYNPSIDTTDQSVCFKVNNQLYWINISGTTSPLLYTLNTKGMKFSGTPGEIARKREDAQIATNTVNAKSCAKAYVNGDQVVFCFPMYAAYPENFEKCINTAINDLAALHNTFMDAYKEAAHVSKKRHEYWYNLDTTCVIVEQPRHINVDEPIKTEADYGIRDFAIRNVDDRGEVISSYNTSLRRSEVKFIQPIVRLEPYPNVNGNIKICVKIYDPQGRLMLPAKGAPFTTVSYGEVTKKDKDPRILLNKFGSNDNSIWQAGEYRIEFWDDNQLLKKSTFNIL